nr:MAG TPA: Ragulator complex protein LAMTOR3, Ragulator Rag GTPase complex, scaffold.02A [Caudoviricetes sp.]
MVFDLQLHLIFFIFVTFIYVKEVDGTMPSRTIEFTIKIARRHFNKITL